MKALLKKDIFVLLRQMKAFLLMIAVFAVLPGMNMGIFAIVYCGMLPFTAMAYDERSKWNNLAAMMPYTVGDLVLSKYLLGWLSIGAATALSLAASLILGRFFPSGYDMAPSVALPAFCIGLMMIAVTLPLMFLFGVEKGRMLLVLLMVVLACGGAGLVQGFMYSNEGTPTMLNTIVMLVIPVLAAVLTAISVPLSIVLYRRRCAS